MIKTIEEWKGFCDSFREYQTFYIFISLNHDEDLWGMGKDLPKLDRYLNSPHKVREDIGYHF